MSSVNEHSHEIGTSAPVFYRTYSRRKPNGQRETYQEAVNDRLLPGMFQLGNYTEQERDLLRSQLTSQTTFPSGRFMWVGGTEWSKKPGNVYGFYNCTSTIIETIEDLIMQMGLAMMGCGTGAVLLEENLSRLPKIRNRIEVKIVGEISSKYDPSDPKDETILECQLESERITVGDSREGWLESIAALVKIARDQLFAGKTVNIDIDLGHIRPFPSPLSGFGGVANPVLLPQIYGRIAAILNGVHDHGGELTPKDVCLIIDECAKVVVAGNVRRSAGIRQFSANHSLLKLGLWNCDDQGNWSIDPEKDALRMANHTRVWFEKPALAEIEKSVRFQYECGEGAIQYAPEALRRANADIKLRYRRANPQAGVDDLSTESGRIAWIKSLLPEDHPLQSDVEELTHRANRFGLNPCFAAGTMVLTKAGVFPIEQLVDKTDVEVYDGSTWIATQFKVTGQDQEVYKLIVSGDNTPECEIFATRHHKFILANGSRKELKDLVAGDQLQTHRFFIEGRKALDANLMSRTAEVVSVQYSHMADKVYCCTVSTTHAFALACGIMVGNCGEIIGSNFMCNLSEVHLNQIDPFDWVAQIQAFEAATLFAAPLLAQKFPDEKYQRSRELDPIVGVSFTGLFDFFVHLFGIEWLEWWKAGRPKDWTGKWWNASLFAETEQNRLERWRETVQDTLQEYCERNNLKAPNRCTTVQPSGTKSLLTGASPGWHPPKAPWFIRRITFGRDDAVARACMFYGYNVIPSQSDKDENGNLLTDPFDPRCTEWLVEIPTAVPWADTPGVEAIDVSRFPAAAQFDFYMQVQRHYATHNCFARNTKFLTDKGIRTFEDFDVDDEVRVLNLDGEWAFAKVVNTGHEREMIFIKIEEGKTGKRKVITSTLCHRFPVRRISPGNSQIKVLQAKDLKPGHRLVLNSPDLPSLDLDGVRHGIVFGDGSRYKNSKGEYHYAQLYLCGGKRHLKSYFESFERCYEHPEIDQIRIYGLPVHWKTLPSGDADQSYIAGFIAGLLATDGHISKSSVSIATANKDVIDFLIDQAPRLGIKVTTWRKNKKSEKCFAPGAESFCLNFSKFTFPENMILRPHHLESFQSNEHQPCQWRVVEIAPAPRQVGWCVMEPKTEHFTLADNILVMNTSGTVELSESEIPEIARLIHEDIHSDDPAYVSVTLLARSEGNTSFPRLPFEPITKQVYEQLMEEVLVRRQYSTFEEAMAVADSMGSTTQTEFGPAGCDSDKCLLGDTAPA